MHACFERLERSSDLDRLSDASLRETIQRRVPGRDDAWCDGPIALFRSAMEHAGIREAIDGPSGPSVVRREFPIVDRSASRVRLGIIDRLLLELDASPGATPPATPTVHGASILVFQTDPPGDGSEADR